jgi:WD40 repeat protein
MTASREGIWDLVWSPDGKRAAIWDSNGVRIFDMQSGQLLWTYILRISQALPVISLRLAWSPNGKQLFLVTTNTFRVLDVEKDRLALINTHGDIQIWSTSGGDPTWVSAPYDADLPNSYINARPWISWLPEGDVLASGYFLGEYSLWQASTGKLLFQKSLLREHIRVARCRCGRQVPHGPPMQLA